MLNVLKTTHRPPAAKGTGLIPKEVISALADMTSFLTKRLVDKAKNRGWEPSPLIPLKQISRVHLVRHVRELVAPAVGHDHVAAGLEGLQVVRDLWSEELRRVQLGLVDHHGHALGLHALHDTPGGARAKVVEVRQIRLGRKDGRQYPNAKTTYLNWGQVRYYPLSKCSTL